MQCQIIIIGRPQQKQKKNKRDQLEQNVGPEPAIEGLPGRLRWHRDPVEFLLDPDAIWSQSRALVRCFGVVWTGFVLRSAESDPETRPVAP